MTARSDGCLLSGRAVGSRDGVRFGLLIFDFDGTLADSFPAFQLAFQEAIPRFGMRAVAPDEVPMLRGKSAMEVIRFLQLPMWKVPRVGKFIRERMAEQPARLFPGVAEALRELAAAGATLTAVSSNSEANVRAGLGAELSALFATFDCGASLFGKAAKFRALAKRYRGTTGEPLAIGDELRDAEAAKSAGIAFGAVAWGYTDVEALKRSGPAVVFREPQDLRMLAT